MSTTDIKEILRRHEYQVVVYHTVGGCMVVYPCRIEPPITDAIRVSYMFVDGGLSITVFAEDGSVLKNETIKCPNCTQRLLMFCHLISRCSQINFTLSLLQFNIGDKEVEEDTFYGQCVSQYMTTEDIQREEILKPIIIQCMFGGFSEDAEEYCNQRGVGNEYRYLRRLIMGEPEGNHDQEEKNIVDG